MDFNEANIVLLEGYPELPEGRCGVIGPICMPTQPSEAVVRGIHLRSFAVRV